MEWNRDRKITKKQLGTEITEISLAAFVAAFLDGVSDTSVSKAVSAGLNTLGKLKNASVDDFMRIGGFGESKAILLKYGILEHEKEMKEYIARGDFRLITPPPDDAASALSLNGISFCFTGSLETMTRSEAKEKVRLLGGATLNSVKPGLSFLVNNNPQSVSSKNRAAHDLGIPVIDEKAFYTMINHVSMAESCFNDDCPPDRERTDD
jgi:DNA ligase (NAD+)